jgi:hypothetical protein
MSGSALWDIAWTGLKGVGGAVRSLLLIASTQAAMAVFLPGLLAIIGLRGLLAQLYGLRVLHRNMQTVFGGELEIGGDRRLHGERASILLFPNLVLVLFGVVLLTPFLVRFVVLGVSPLPAVTASPEILVSRDLGAPEIISAIVANEPLDLLRFWTGIACWYCAAPGYRNVRTGRQELAQVVTKGQRHAGAASILRWATAPVELVARILGVFDDAFTWLGANVLIASGGFTLFALLIIERRVIELIFI